MSPPSLIQSNGSFNIEKKGLRFSFWRDFYHFLISTSWLQLLIFIGLLFILSNLFFASVYYMAGNGITNTNPHSFLDAFFFSVQTMSTVGYGTMSPQNHLTNGIMVFESIYGFLFLALITGVIFTKFSRIKARILFSNHLLINKHNGQDVLTFRAANERSSDIVEAHINVSMSLNETTLEGHRFRQIYDLELIRNRSPLFTLAWNVFHPLTEKSPLYGLSKEDLEKAQAVFIITFMGTDDKMGQTIHTRHMYTWDNLRWGCYFKDLFSQKEDGTAVIDYSYFHSLKESA